MTEGVPEQPVIMMTEDDEEMRNLLHFFLEREGFEIVFATDGQEAQTMIDLMMPPQLVLLDIMLPYMNGFELITYIKHKPGWERVPILMLSARSEERDVVRALDAGANDYVIKPFKPNELVARIRRIINTSR
ncbi:MAG: response regulator transcription factor [bacterium]|nr:response regulator transcription factor [bacterium]